jgi:hypothetical protein
VNHTLTPHVVKRAEEKGVALALLWEILANPQTAYPSFQRTPNGRQPYLCRKCGAQQQKVTGTTRSGVKLCLVVNPCCGDVVTFWFDQVETELRADQVAAGVTDYRGADGTWRFGGGGQQPTPKPNGKPLTAKQKKALKKARHARRQQGGAQ